MTIRFMGSAITGVDKLQKEVAKKCTDVKSSFYPVSQNLSNLSVCL